jgi:site-specific recombinase XerD
VANLAVSPRSVALTVDLAVEDRARALRADATPQKTHETYDCYWRLFVEWCAESKKSPFPASAHTLVHYVLHLSERGCSISTAHVALAAIVRAHKKQNTYCERYDPSVSEALRGMARRQASRPEAKKSAITVDILEKLVLAQPVSLTGTRNRALLLLGFATATRSNELVSLEVADVKFESRGQGTVCIRRSKTDQVGEGALVPIYRAKNPMLCPMQALRDWTIAANVRSGPLFRKIDCWGHVEERPLSPGAMWVLVKESCERAGMDPRPFGSHSLRAGFVTSAARAGVPLEVIMRTTRHKNINTLLGYVREIKAMENGAGRDLL